MIEARVDYAATQIALAAALMESNVSSRDRVHQCVRALQNTVGVRRYVVRIANHAAKF